MTAMGRGSGQAAARGALAGLLLDLDSRPSTCRPLGLWCGVWRGRERERAHPSAAWAGEGRGGGIIWGRRGLREGRRGRVRE